MIYLTSDIHRDIDYIIDFIKNNSTSLDDVLICLGDGQINYFEDNQDDELKARLSSLPMTFLFIQGNKEKRAESIKPYHLIKYQNNLVYVEDRFPNLLFAKDGEIYHLQEKDFLILGGAYSIYAPKHADGDFWWANEQISLEAQKDVLSRLNDINKIQNLIILSHTCPKKYLPYDASFIKDNLQTLNTDEEEFLDRIEENIHYQSWYCGHFHIHRDINRLHIIYHEIISLHE